MTDRELCKIGWHYPKAGAAAGKWRCTACGKRGVECSECRNPLFDDWFHTSYCSQRERGNE